MGYYSRLSGDLELNPPIPLALISDSKFLGEDRPVKYNLFDDVLDDAFAEPLAMSVVVCWEDQAKMYDLEKWLNELAAEIQAAGSGAEGYLIREGEAQGDVERYALRSGRCDTEKAVLTWPDGTSDGL